MESTALGVLAFALIAFSIKEIALIWIVYQRRRVLRRIIEIERCQHLFAEARGLLLDAMIDGDLDPRSKTFRVLYYVNTFLLRRPAMYHNKINVPSPLKPEQGKMGNLYSLEDEYLTWTLKVGQAVAKTAIAMNFVVWDLNPRLRILYRIQKWRNPELTPLEFLYGHKQQLKSAESQQVEEFHAAQEKVQTLAAMVS